MFLQSFSPNYIFILFIQSSSYKTGREKSLFQQNTNLSIKHTQFPQTCINYETTSFFPHRRNNNTHYRAHSYRNLPKVPPKQYIEYSEELDRPLFLSITMIIYLCIHIHMLLPSSPRHLLGFGRLQQWRKAYSELTKK